MYGITGNAQKIGTTHYGLAGHLREREYEPTCEQLVAAWDRNDKEALQKARARGAIRRRPRASKDAA